MPRELFDELISQFVYHSYLQEHCCVSVLPLLGESLERGDAADEHVQVVERRDGRRQVPLRRVQLLDVARYVANHRL